MKFPETKIGESVVKAEDWLAKKVEEIKPAVKVAPPPPASPPKIPLPPRIHMRGNKINRDG